MRPSAALLVLSLISSAVAAQTIAAAAQIGTPPAPSATAAPPMPRDYRGVQTHLDGIFVTPVAGAPFTATVQIVSHNKLPDGTEHVVTTINHIARSSSGRMRNERRALVPASFTGEPMLLSAHFFDPNTLQNIYTEPSAHIARLTILPPRRPTNQAPPRPPSAENPSSETSLGEQRLDGVVLQGTRKTRIIPAARSGTGQPVTITDDYWYSPDLSIYLIIRHDDPRTGEQLVAVTHIERSEPPAELLSVPADYKIVDETPPPPPLAAH